MIYNNQPYFNQMTPQYGGSQQTHLRQTEIIRVNGENGAMALQMMPNSQVLLLDNNAPIVWLAQTDGAGYKTVTPYTITPYQKQEPINMENLEQRISKLEEMITNDQSNITESKSNRNDKSNKSSQKHDG